MLKANHDINVGGCSTAWIPACAGMTRWLPENTAKN
jgi:hypothetical protein